MDSSEMTKRIKLDKPRCCTINWKFNIIEQRNVEWSAGYYGNWNLLSDYPQVEELQKRIERIENKVYGCAICGGVMSMGGFNNHHLIGGSVPTLHPTEQRILEYITIGVCTTCHAGSGGFLHSDSEHTQLIEKKYKPQIKEKMKKINDLLFEVDQLALTGEIEIVGCKLKEIRDLQEKYILDGFQGKKARVKDKQNTNLNKGGTP